MSSPSPTSGALPEWIEVHHGRTPLLLFAPHGGRRTLPRLPGRDKVNDLHTAALTRELGVACDATWIINATCDRNELDLNRTPQIRARAPWLLELLATTLESMVAAHGGAVLLAVHGWNAVQSVCDVGVGLVEEHGTCRPTARGEATVSAAFLDGHVRRLQRRARTCDVLVTIGARYPAAHPSNLMQLFTPGRAADPDPLLRRLGSLAATVDAAQLELGIPLRWPGPRRAAFLGALTDVFAAPASRVGTTARRTDEAAELQPQAPRRAREDAHAAGAAPSMTAAVLACGGRPTSRVGLQLASGPLTLLTSIDVAPSGAVAGRLLVSDTAERLTLFTGELAERGAHALRVPALQLEIDTEHALDVHFTGPMLAFPMLTPFADLEHGLAAGTLEDAVVELRFTPAHPFVEVPAGTARFGTAVGMVRLGHARYDVHTPAHVNEGLPAPRRHPSARLVLPGTALGDVELCSTHVRTIPSAGAAVTTRPEVFHVESTGVAWSNGHAVPISAVAELSFATPAVARIRITADGGGGDLLAGSLERVIPVRRPGTAGRVVETFFAVCRTSAFAAGWLELTIEHAAEVDEN